MKTRNVRRRKWDRYLMRMNEQLGRAGYVPPTGYFLRVVGELERKQRKSRKRLVRWLRKRNRVS